MYQAWRFTQYMAKDKGGRRPVVPDRHILQFFTESDDPALSAQEIADELPIGHGGVFKRLQDLEKRGLIDSKKLGQARAWWITEEGEAYLTNE